MTGSARKGPGRPADPGLRDRRCEEILEAAARLFARRGYSQTETQVLADKLRVGKGTLYRYFSDKEELYLALLERASRQLLAQLEEQTGTVLLTDLGSRTGVFVRIRGEQELVHGDELLIGRTRLVVDLTAQVA